MNCFPVSPHSTGGQQRSRRLVHKGHELVRKSRHGAANTDAADIGTAANTAHPAAFAYIAQHHWSPASQFHDAQRRSIFFGKIGLLVVPAAVAAFMHGLSKK